MFTFLTANKFLNKVYKLYLRHMKTKELIPNRLDHMKSFYFQFINLSLYETLVRGLHKYLSGR